MDKKINNDSIQPFITRRISSHSISPLTSKFISPRIRASSAMIEPSTNIFINYIPAEFTENDLRNLCSKYGNIVRSKIMINLDTGKSKCFGFVRFENLAQAQKAIMELNGMEIGKKQLLAKYAQSNEKIEQVTEAIYIKRLPLTVNIQQVQQIFSKFGIIIQISPHMFTGIDSQTWRCIIRYTNKQSASEAISVMNNQIIHKNSKPIHVRYADESKIDYPIFHQCIPFEFNNNIYLSSENDLLKCNCCQVFY